MALKTFDNLDQKKKNRIFREAVREFAAKGYAKASINAMVQNLGIAKGSIFQYFRDKEGLFNFVFSRSVEIVKDHLKGVRKATEDRNFFVRLEALLTSGVQFVRKHPRIYTLYVKIQFEGNLGFCSRMLASLRRESFEFLSQLISTGIERGELDPTLDITHTAFILDAILDRFLQAHMLEHLDAGLDLKQADVRTTESWATEIVGLLRRGLENRSDAP
jgi:TetR/AcrR family transcriptional regulator